MRANRLAGEMRDLLGRADIERLEIVKHDDLFLTHLFSSFSSNALRCRLSSDALRCRASCERFATFKQRAPPSHTMRAFCPNVGLDLCRQQLERALDDIFDGEAEMVQHVLRRGGGAERLHPDDIAVRANPSIP